MEGVGRKAEVGVVRLAHESTRQDVGGYEKLIDRMRSARVVAGWLALVEVHWNYKSQTSVDWFSIKSTGICLDDSDSDVLTYPKPPSCLGGG